MRTKNWIRMAWKAAFSQSWRCEVVNRNTGPLYAHTTCGYLLEICTRSRQSTFSHGVEGVHEPLPLNGRTRTVHGFWEKESVFFKGMNLIG